MSRVKENTLVLVDRDVLSKLEGQEAMTGIDLIPISAIETAKRLGNPIVANMVLLGALAKRSELLRVDDLRGAVKGMMRPSLQEINLKAIEAGYSEA
jgi:2-oxoglutarate ferredoxin oxidoreductase subunit gamma